MFEVMLLGSKLSFFPRRMAISLIWVSAGDEVPESEATQNICFGLSFRTRNVYSTRTSPTTADEPPVKTSPDRFPDHKQLGKPCGHVWTLFAGRAARPVVTANLGPWVARKIRRLNTPTEESCIRREVFCWIYCFFFSTFVLNIFFSGMSEHFRVPRGATCLCSSDHFV